MKNQPELYEVFKTSLETTKNPKKTLRLYRTGKLTQETFEEETGYGTILKLEIQSLFQIIKLLLNDNFYKSDCDLKSYNHLFFCKKEEKINGLFTIDG